MKYLENLDLEQLTRTLSNFVLGGRQIQGRVECFSTKKVHSEKRQSKLLREQSGLNATSPESIPILVDLIQTLNASLPDYDFSDLVNSPESFSTTSVNDAMRTINTLLAEVTTENGNFLYDLWRKIDESIGVGQCDVYKLNDDPFLEEEGVAWSFTYFLCNKDAKRILFLNAVATNKFRKSDMYGASIDEDDDDDDNAGYDSPRGSESESDMDIDMEEVPQW